MSVFSSIKFFVKSVVFGTVLAGCALYGVIASIALRLVNKLDYAQYTVARAFYYTFSWIMGVKIKLINEKYLLDTPAIVISNHQSALDIFVLARVFQPGYTVTGKKSLKYIPILGWFMLLSGTFFLDRSKGVKARKVLESSLQTLKTEDRALFMFPEGTRSATHELELLEFKKGAFHLAKQAGIPIIPVVVSNTSTIFNAKTKTFNRGEITIEVLPAVSTEHLKTNEDVTEFARKIREDMLKTLKNIGYSKTSGSVKHLADTDDASEDTTEDATDSETVVIDENTPLVKKSAVKEVLAK